MLNIMPRNQISEPSATDKDFEAGSVDIENIIRAARRQKWVLLLACVVSLVIGLVYLANVVPRFRATAVVLIGNPKDKSGLSASIAALTYDSGAIDSQLEVLKSEGIAQSVMSSLKLSTPADIEEPRHGLLSDTFGKIRALFQSSDEGVSDTDDIERDDEVSARRQAMFAQLVSNLDVRRVGRSYVINIDYSSPDRMKAAYFANAFAKAYVRDQVDARFDAVRNASEWLEKRVIETKQKSMSLDLAVQKFKSEHGLVTVDGKLVTDQQLSELSTQLIIARGSLAKAEARYSQIRTMIENKDVNGVVSGTLESSLINGLREKYLSAAQLNTEITNSVGADHPQAINLKRSMAEYTRLIFDEMTRIAAAYASDVAVAKANETSLRQSIAAVADQSDEKTQILVQLRDMQREADSYRALYSTFVERLQQAREGQVVQESEARIITEASPPSTPSYPKKAVVMALCLVCGLVCGVGVGAFRESRDTSFRTSADVTNGLRLEFLGNLPFVKPKQVRGPSQVNKPGEVDPGHAVLRYSVDNPLTIFSETLRSMKVAVDLQLDQRTTKIVGIVSVLPHEGKTMVSKNFASLIAHLGYQVLLIDGDLHHPALTNTIGSHAEIGLLEVLNGDTRLEDALLLEPASGLHFLPAVMKQRLSGAGQILNSAGMQKMLVEAGHRFDYIIIDLPPIGAVVDVRAAAGLFDAFVCVVRWGETVREMLKAALAADREIANRCIGVVYNQVNLKNIKLYEGVGSTTFHVDQFAKYYST